MSLLYMFDGLKMKRCVIMIRVYMYKCVFFLRSNNILYES